MPARETREIDGVTAAAARQCRLVEADELSHFNPHRALHLERYPDGVPFAFPRDALLAAPAAEAAGRSRRPPLFPLGAVGTASAFRDAPADLLPPLSGYAPTHGSPTSRSSPGSGMPVVPLPGLRTLSRSGWQGRRSLLPRQTRQPPSSRSRRRWRQMSTGRLGSSEAGSGRGWRAPVQGCPPAGSFGQSLCHRPLC